MVATRIAPYRSLPLVKKSGVKAVSSLACDMLYRYLHVFIWWVSAATVLAQAPRFYIGYGIHRAEYLNSNIRIDQPVYGRTLFFRNVGAHDQPDYEAYASKDISIPQFQLKVGYRIAPRLYLEASLHHLKYKIDEQVLVDLEERMEGSYTRQLVNITSVMPKYEHSDGLNMVLLSVAVPFQVQRTGKWYSDFTLLAKVGPGVPIAHSDNAIISPSGALEYNRKRFHLAGVGVVAGPELRYQVLSHLFMSVSYKGLAVRITDAPVYGGSSAHSIFGHQFSFTAGYTPKVALRRNPSLTPPVR